MEKSVGRWADICSGGQTLCPSWVLPALHSLVTGHSTGGQIARAAGGAHGQPLTAATERSAACCLGLAAAGRPYKRVACSPVPVPLTQRYCTFRPLMVRGFTSAMTRSPTAQSTSFTSTTAWTMPTWPRTRHLWPLTETRIFFGKSSHLK